MKESHEFIIFKTLTEFSIFRFEFRVELKPSQQVGGCLKKNFIPKKKIQSQKSNDNHTILIHIKMQREISKTIAKITFIFKRK